MKMIYVGLSEILGNCTLIYGLKNAFSLLDITWGIPHFRHAETCCNLKRVQSHLTDAGIKATSFKTYLTLR